MSKYPDPIWSPAQIKEELKLDLDVKEVHQKLEMMRESGLIHGTPSDYEYQGQKDGTFHLILQERLKNEIHAFRSDLVESVDSRLARLKSRNDSLQGALSLTTGLLGEYQLAYDMLSHQKFPLDFYFEKIEEGDLEFQIEEIYHRFFIQTSNPKKWELDLKIEGQVKIEGAITPRSLLIEVKKWKTPVGLDVVKTFWEKVVLYQRVYPQETVIPAFLALGGFVAKALDFCQEKKIGTASEIRYHNTEWTS